MTGDGINVLSLFDGMSAGQLALQIIGVKVKNYYASEINKSAIQKTMDNFPNTIQLGDVRSIDTLTLPKIDLLIGGSPCTDFSFQGKNKGMSTKCKKDILDLETYLALKEQNFEFEGESYLFWEYMRINNSINPNYFFLENVLMTEKWKKVLTKAIGINSILINSSLVSAQNRKRMYWTNIGTDPAGLFGDTVVCGINQPKDKGIYLKDVLEKEVDQKYSLNKVNYISNTTVPHIVASRGRDVNGKWIQQLEARKDGKSNTLTTVEKDNRVFDGSVIRRLTPVEYERLQTFPDNYSKGISDASRYKMLGNSWTVDVIAHIFSYLPYTKKD